MGLTSECKDAQRCLREDEMKKIGILAPAQVVVKAILLLFFKFGRKVLHTVA